MQFINKLFFITVLQLTSSMITHASELNGGVDDNINSNNKQSVDDIARSVPMTDPRVRAEVEMALEIVHKYRSLREECSVLPENLRVMCLYRLNIGNWDYKEAKLILARHHLL